MPGLFHWHLPNVVGIITLAIWLHIFFGRGWFWFLPRWDADRSEVPLSAEWPSVVAVVPARNEQETIGPVVASLARQDYPGRFQIVIVDDHSEDATAANAAKAVRDNSAEDRVSFVSASPLESGWTGKLWALNEGVKSIGDAAENVPSLFWFTDADITHAPDTLRRLVGLALREQTDLASLMVLLQAKTFPERALIPAFLYFFLMLYPPKWIADEELGTAGAAGGCILLRREALEKIGGFAAIRAEVIDDCALAKAVKNNGGYVRMGLTRKSISLRAYETFGEIRDLISRTAFTQLRYSMLLLMGTLAGMFLTYVVPILLLFARDPIARLLGFIAWFLMALSFVPAARFYRVSLLWPPLLPLTAMFYSSATWQSAVRYWKGAGGLWKGRAQAPGKQ